MQIISIFTYSEILALASLALGAAVIISFVGYFTSTTMRARLTAISYEKYLKAIAFLAIGSAAGALIYQYYYETPVCVLCWWQRIFMFPVGVIALVALRYKEKAAHISSAILAFIGSLFALRHYYGHFQIHVQKNADYVMTCDAYGGGLPDCASTTLVQTFGFVTIPLMALIGFVAIMWLCFLAHKAKK